MERVDVDVVEGRDAHPRPFQGQARQKAPAQGQDDQSLGLEDVEYQAGVLQAIGAEGCPVLAVHFRNLLRPRTPGVVFEQLAAAQDGVGHGIQAVVLEPLQRAAKQVQGVQDLPAVDHHGAAAPDFPGAVPGLVVGPPELKRHVQVPETSLQDLQVEIDQVPSREQVGVHFQNPGRYPAQHGSLIGPADELRGIIRGRFADHVDLFRGDAAAGIRQDQAHGVNGARFGIRFDIQGQHAEIGFPVSRVKCGVAVHPVDPFAGCPGACNPYAAS